ncbi:MAG: arsenate reductase (glutaredoxin) [Gammaproteobacteria bacterium]|jgi:arsenate reductase
MTSAIKIFHNPRCSKSRQTMQLIESIGFIPEVIEYLKQPPGYDELAEVLGLLGMEPRELMRSGEKAYQENNLDDPGLSREDLIKAMIDNPILIERPIVIHNGKAIIGRPPEKVREIL